eukprot:CAMPEP_0119019778 /NCGR_PEP_ID=MMETSP1176-20130426/22629_1 /TAXON_ID=265551 /ORGANISM="Synedropsis recta cf, Strain CCMP1620" /LENGTH=240 /DNA_ID=CAMNT_0006974063 /DNA_START=36 /DNA_END=758 /DNA_ORIENTATION=+
MRRRVRKAKGFSVQFILFLTVVLWFGVVLFGLGRLVTPSSASASSSSIVASVALRQEDETVHNENVIQFHLQTTTPPVVIRLKLFAEEAPDAARFVKQVALGHQSTGDCNLYRAEPVPEYWGSPDRPDRWFDGGRWGPPYALIQGKMAIDNHEIAEAEDHRPIIQRGMVAWAGGKGGPHFFIALADHPEWKHDHTVWATVLEEDMALVDALMNLPLKTITPKRPPILSYFVTPIDFTVTN